MRLGILPPALIKQSGEPTSIWLREKSDISEISVSRSYLLVIAKIHWVKCDTILHFQPEAYYKDVLKGYIYPGSKENKFKKLKCRDVGMDLSGAGKKCGAKKRRHDIEDGKSHMAKKFIWKECKFQPRKGQYEQLGQWEVTCLESKLGHASVLKKSTLCKKTLSYNTIGEEETVLRLLKYWAMSHHRFTCRSDHVAWTQPMSDVSQDVEL